MYLWGFSDIHHLNGDWHPAQCCHAPAPQSSALPGGHHGLLLPPGPQAEEDLSWLCDTSREGTAEHRSQTWGQKVWNIIWLGLGALHCQWMPPACPLPWDLAYYNPQYFTDEHSLTFQTLQQERETSWWKWITLSLGCEVKPLLTHIPPLCSSECRYNKEGARVCSALCSCVT